MTPDEKQLLTDISGLLRKLGDDLRAKGDPSHAQTINNVDKMIAKVDAAANKA